MPDPSDAHVDRLRKSAAVYRAKQREQEDAYAAMVAQVNAAYDAGIGGERIGRAIGLTEGAARQIRKRSQDRARQDGQSGSRVGSR